MEGRPVEVVRLDPRGVAGQGHEAEQLVLHAERRLQIPGSHLGLRHVALHEAHRPSVQVLHVLLEGEGPAPIRLVAYDGQRSLLEQEGGDGRAQAANASGYQDDTAGQALAIEVVAAFFLSLDLGYVQEAGGHPSPRRVL